MPQPRRRILCAESNADICYLVSTMLRQEGHEVVTASTVAEGVERARSGRFDLYVLDDFYPDGDGFDLCRELRRLSGELSDPATTAAVTQPEKRQRSSRSSRRAAAPAVQAFGTDYASALERWRELRAAAAPNSETLVNDAPTEPHPDDHALIEQRYIRTGDSAPPQPAFDPSLSQPPMPTAWPGAADTTTSAEPVDSGLPPPDPEKPSATIYELPRRGRDRT